MHTIAMMSPEDLPAIAAMDLEDKGHAVELDALRTALTQDASRVFVVREQGIAVAYVDSWFVAGEVHVLNVVTAIAHRRRGLARALLLEVIATAKREGFERVLLEVRKGNAPARALYVSLGFDEDGVRRRYYDDGEDAVLMSRAP